MPGNMIILYVTEPAESADFYTKMLGTPPVESSPNFVMFALGEALALGLWRRDDVAAATAGDAELVTLLPSPAAVDAAHAAWPGTVAEPPRTREFGHSFVATDPDGHRIRLLAPG